MKITKAQLKQIIKEELIAIHERAAMPEQDDGTVDGSWLKKGYDWLKKKGEEHKAQASLPDDYDSPRERAGAERGGQSKAVPGQDYSVRAPGSGNPWWEAFPGKTPARRRAPPALHPGDRTGGISTSDGRSAISDEEEPWETTTVASGDIGEWKPGMPKPKLPKNWRTLPYKDPRRAAYRDWYKYIKSKRKARERRKALAKLSRDAATLPLSDQSRAKMGDPSAGPWPNVRVPPVDPYDPIIGNRRLAPRYENKITIDSIKELIQEVLSNK